MAVAKNKIEIVGEDDAADQVLAFNVEEEEEEAMRNGDCDWKSYSRFIDKIRTRYIPSDIKQLRLLSGQIDIVLRTHSRATKLRLNHPTFDLVGYQMEMDGRWFEFGYDHTWENYLPIHEIPGSSLLELSADYICLESALAVGLTMDDIDLGQRQLTTAVNLLATSMDLQDRAWSLLIVNLMICGAIRFDCVSNYIAHVHRDGLPLPRHMLRLIRLSTDFDIQLLRDNPKTGFVSQHGQVYCPSLHPLIQEKESMMNPAPKVLNRDQGARPLAEIFSVCVHSINKQDSGDFYGAIFVCDFYGSQYIYNREREDPEFIHSGENLLLTGPSECASAICPFGISFVIFGKRIPNRLVQIEWDPNNSCHVYDEPLSGDFDTAYCSLTLDYIVLSGAMQAKVEVTIMEIINGGRSWRSIYGKISATSPIFDGHEITLFQKKHVRVCAGGHLKLSRSVVAVPCDSSLIIQVKLCDHDGDHQSSFAQGILEFPAQFFGSSEKNISSNHTEIQVRVTWS